VSKYGSAVRRTMRIGKGPARRREARPWQDAVAGLTMELPSGSVFTSE
jgi:hypothetical protein